LSNFTIRLLLDGGKSLELYGPADITRESTDAIVNAANSSLMGGGGVDGAIHRAGGPSILEECAAIVARTGHLPPGKAAITAGGRLAARHVIHTVGPIYHDGRRDEAATLASCYRESIRLADRHSIRSLAFPSISTGAYRYPLADAAAIAIATVVEVLPSATHVAAVRFVLFDDPTLQAYLTAAQNLRHPQTASPYQTLRGPQ